MLWPLPSGRVIQTVFRDINGQPKYYEILDTRSNARRIVHGPWWDGNDKSVSDGPVISEADLPAVIEFFMEDEQSYWKHARPHAGPKNLILFPGAFTWCRPLKGDILRGHTTGNIYTVQHVPEGINGNPWNGVVMLDKDVESGEILRWSGQKTRERNLIVFQSDDGAPISPLPGEVTSGDVGTAYPGVSGPTVTYLLLRQEPASVGPKPFGRDKQLKPRIREQVSDPARPQVVITIYGHRMENEFRFRCLHPQSAVADELALWFKRFMRNNTGPIRSNGVNEILYFGQESVQASQLGHVAGRDVRYYFRTEELILQEDAAIREVNVNISVLVRQDQEAFRLNAAFSQDGLEGMDPFTGLYDQSGNFLFGALDIADYGTTGFES